VTETPLEKHLRESEAAVHGMVLREALATSRQQHDMASQEAFRVIKDAVEKHIETMVGAAQWYVDEFVIDCDAEEFWKVVGKALGVER